MGDTVFGRLMSAGRPGAVPPQPLSPLTRSLDIWCATALRLRQTVHPESFCRARSPAQLVALASSWSRLLPRRRIRIEPSLINHGNLDDVRPFAVPDPATPPRLARTDEPSVEPRAHSVACRERTWGRLSRQGQGQRDRRGPQGLRSRHGERSHEAHRRCAPPCPAPSFPSNPTRTDPRLSPAASAPRATTTHPQVTPSTSSKCACSAPHRARTPGPSRA